nr:MAG TPA: hypothetical protein [Caudoviricetes sp.]
MLRLYRASRIYPPPLYLACDMIQVIFGIIK